MSPLAAKARYLLRGVAGALTTRPVCPSCRATRSTTVDRKLVFTLRECAECRLLFRHPRESADAMAEFYQDDYAQEGLTTDLPDDAELARLMQSNFAGTRKDASRTIGVLRALGLGAGARILDYGASWGYTSFQLRAAGFEVAAFEISRPRARFGAKLGVEIHDRLDAIAGPFDAVYSGHVLEHTPDPRASLAEQLALVRPGGFVIGHTPNGSAARRSAQHASFHRHWGEVHPVLLSDAFLASRFPECARYVSSETDLEALAAWDRATTIERDLSGAELFLVLRRRTG